MFSKTNNSKFIYISFYKYYHNIKTNSIGIDNINQLLTNQYIFERKYNKINKFKCILLYVSRTNITLLLKMLHQQA